MKAKAQRMENEISYKIIGAAVEVHRTLGGPGLLDSIYESSLCYELQLRGLKFKQQLIVPVKYKNTIVRDPLCLDILVDHQAQLLTYLRLTGLKLGLLINFGQGCIKQGVCRVVNCL